MTQASQANFDGVPDIRAADARGDGSAGSRPAADDFAVLFDATAPALVLYARQWLSAAAAEDVVQEAFVRLLDHGGRPPNAKAWLYRTVRNAAISEVRTATRRQRRERDAARPDWFDAGHATRLDAQAAQAALETLPAAQREVVVLRLWGQMTLREVADLTGSAISTIHDQYRAALAHVRRQLEAPWKTKHP